ncbi:MAG TPA: PDZ domain-containing protein [Gammaproteobacteria bacterium]|nr:PDZ domain-containing protein [Gammaproteobacteria bacterium]
MYLNLNSKQRISRGAGIAVPALFALLVVAGAARGQSAAPPGAPENESKAAQSSAPAQSAPPEAQTPRDFAKAQAQAQRDYAKAQAQATRDLAKARTQAQNELEKAQTQLEAAAREVARLSAERTAAVMGELKRQWSDWTGERVMLGINVEDAARGARVNAVSPGGPADEAGIRMGDVILSIDGHDLTAGGQSASRMLIMQLAQVQPGDKVSLRVLRGGQDREVTVQAREAARPFFAITPPRVNVKVPDVNVSFGPKLQGLLPFGRWHDMELVSLTPDLGAYFGTDEGILVVRAPSDDTLQLHDGDVILKIGDRKPTSPEHAMRILGSFEPGETLHLTIMRQQKQEMLEVKLSDDKGVH